MWARPVLATAMHEYKAVAGGSEEAAGLVGDYGAALSVRRLQLYMGVKYLAGVRSGWRCAK